MELTVSAPAPLRLRPLEVGDVLDETFRIYRRHFVLFAGISLILAIPSAGLQGYGFFSLFNNLFKAVNPGQTFDFNTLTPTLVVLGIGFLVNLLLSPFIYGALINAVSASAQGRRVQLPGPGHFARCRPAHRRARQSHHPDRSGSHLLRPPRAARSPRSVSTRAARVFDTTRVRPS